MHRQGSIRTLAFAATLACSAAAHAIDFTLLQTGQVPAALCASNAITNVSGVAVSYNLLDNGGLANVRFSWSITPSVGPQINQFADYTLDPESAVQTDVQSWFNANFGGSISVPGNPPLPWTGTITGSPINPGGNVVGQTASFTVQCNAQAQASIVNIVVAAPVSFPVPANSPLVLVAMMLGVLGLGARWLERRRGKA